ncbi:MAG: MerR family transcriptional regulator [bacterium]
MTISPDTRLPADENYSIGEAAALAGVGVDTIRVWERRYGRPKPIRLASGHRRYTAEQVKWLRQVASALANGHRPSSVIQLPDADIAAVIALKEATPKRDSDVAEFVALTRRFDGALIRAGLHRRWAQLGARRFLLEIVAPMLEQIGEEWVAGRIDIRHEHFISGILEDELRTLRASLGETPNGAVVIFATLPGEDHGLGLQIAALIGALAGIRPDILGTSVPFEQIAEAAVESNAAAVAISVSLSTGGSETDRALASLRDALPDGVRLVAGGRGARRGRHGLRGIDYLTSFDDFEAWLRALRQ